MRRPRNCKNQSSGIPPLNALQLPDMKVLQGKVEKDRSFVAIDDAGRDKANIVKVKVLEVVDTALGQLARLLWVAESTGKFQFFLCQRTSLYSSRI
ncbi:hypothetical protein JHK87_027583 [Glycine soja]|nr:hypothetical protein JHK87_027583 [Glycine soja]